MSEGLFALSGTVIGPGGGFWVAWYSNLLSNTEAATRLGPLFSRNEAG